MIPVLATLLQLDQQELPGANELIERITASSITLILLVLVATYAFARSTTFALGVLGERAPRARFFFNMLAPVTRLGLWAGAIAIVLLGVLAPSFTTLVTVLAPIGIALGLGAQELVKNLIGGIMILVEVPYQIGDRVKIGDAYGEIDHIGLLSTKLTTPDDTRVTIPNGALLSDKAWNANSGNPDCQVVTDLFLPHDTAPVEASGVALEAAYSSPYVLLSKPVVVRVEDRFQDRPHLVVRVKAYVYDHRYEQAFRSDIIVRAKSEYGRRGIGSGWGRDEGGPSG